MYKRSEPPFFYVFKTFQNEIELHRLKAAADMVGANVNRLPGTVEMRGYKPVGRTDDFEQRSFEPDYEEGAASPTDVALWTTAQVAAYLRKRLLEYEGADEETVDELLRTFEDREVQIRRRPLLNGFFA